MRGVGLWILLFMEGGWVKRVIKLEGGVSTTKIELGGLV